MGAPDPKPVEKLALKLPFFRRMRDRFRLLNRKKRYTAFAVAALFLVLLLLGIVVAVLSLRSLTSDDLALYVSVSPDAVTLAPAAEAVVTVTVDAKNLPFCTASCVYTATDQLSGILIANGSLTVHAGVVTTVPLTYTAPRTFEREGLLSVSLACANTLSTLCRSDGATRYATTVVHITSRYPPDQAAARDAVAASLPVWLDALTRDDRFLTALTSNRLLQADSRASVVMDAARIAQQSLTTTISSLHDAVAHERYAQAQQQMAAFTPATIESQYDALRAQESVAVQQFAALAVNLSALDRLTPVPDATDAAIIARLMAAHRATGARFTQQSLDVSLASMTSVMTNLTAIAPSIALNANIALVDAESSYNADTTVLCALYADDAACSPVNRTALPLINRRDLLCAGVQNLPTRYATSRLAFARAVLNDSNASLAEAATLLNVTSVTSNANFTAWRMATLTMARTGTLAVPLSPAQTLALDPQPVTNATELCGRPSEPIPLVNATLPTITPASITLPPTSVPLPQCCDGGACVACPAAQQTPIVFVHGFSFAQGTTPETNLNAFGPLAHWFDERGVRYLGHVFPEQDVAANTSVGDLPGRFSMTTTYYYDSYQQNGKISLISQKSENIETYAIRLREAITAARARTGASKVVIVAHSMGGLVARRYLQIFGENDVAAVILIATPNDGITGSTAQFCGLLGSSLECRDMNAGSVFMLKLNGDAHPTIPVYTIRGEGCDGRAYDGIAEASSVELPWAVQNYAFNGSCSGSELLHSGLLDPTLHPEVAQLIEQIVDKY